MSPDGPAIYSSLTGHETRALQMLAAGQDVVEIGAAYGYSAIAMALKGARVWSIDDHATFNSAEIMWANVCAHRVKDRVIMIRQRSEAALRWVFNAPINHHPGLVFIDADHEYESVMADLVACYGHSDVVAFHDYGEDTCPGVRQAVDEREDLLVPHHVVDTLWVGSWRNA